MNIVVDNSGIKLSLNVSGAGPDVLFVHGLGSDGSLWHPVVELLQDRFRCWNLDLRGHGASDRAPGAYDREDFASDVGAAIEHIGRPTIGVGHSLGGVCLLRLGAAAHPNLKAAYLLDAPAFAVTDGPPPAAALGFQRIHDMIVEYQQEGRPVSDYERWLGATPYVGGGTNAEVMIPEQLHNRAAGLSMLDPECIAVLMNGEGPRTPMPDPAMAAPLRVIAADPDLGAVFRPEHAERLVACTPHAEVDTMTGVGHPLMMVRGFDELVYTDLQEWLDRVG